MATIKPAAPPTWATDANFLSGPKSGSPTKIVPSGGALAQGDVPGQPYRSERKNWILNLLSQYAAYVHGLATDDSFLGAAYTWAGVHTFANAGCKFTSDPGLTSAIPRVKKMSLADFQPVQIAGGSNTWVQQETGGWSVPGDTAMIRKALRFPAGTVITRIRASYVGVNADANVALVRMTHDFTAPLASPTRAILWQTVSGVGSGDQIVDSGTISHTSDDSTDLCIEVTSSLTPWGVGPSEKLLGLEITYNQIEVGGRV